MENQKIYEHECAHLPCGCAVDKAGDYCSDWCEHAFEATDCGCGHIECRAQA